MNWYQTPGNELESKLSYLATHVDYFYKQKIPFGPILPNQVFQVDSSLFHYQSCLEALALYKEAEEPLVEVA